MAMGAEMDAAILYAQQAAAAAAATDHKPIDVVINGATTNANGGIINGHYFSASNGSDQATTSTEVCAVQ